MLDFTRLHSLMDAAGIEALIAVGQRNAMYLTGYVDMERWWNDVNGIALQIPVVAFPDKSFMIGGLFERTDFPGENYDCDQTLEARLLFAAEQLKRRNLDRATIGIDMDYAPIVASILLRDCLPEARFVPADVLLARMRSVKSPQELSYIKTAVSIGEEAFQAASTMLREGVAYRDVANAWAMAVLELGAVPILALPFDFMTQAMPEQPAVNHGLARFPTHAERNCMTRFTFVCCYKGYLSDQKIVVCVGEPAPEAVEIYQEHRARQEFMRSLIKPGMTKTEVFQACYGGIHPPGRVRVLDPWYRPGRA